MQYKNLIGAEIRRRRDNLGWSQSDLAVKLQLAGWDIDRSQVSKIECRLVHLSDYHQVYLAHVFKVTVNDLYPRRDPNLSVSAFVAQVMERSRLPIPRRKGMKPVRKQRRSKK